MEEAEPGRRRGGEREGEARRTLSSVEGSRAWSSPWRRRTSASSATARRRSASSSAARVATRAAAASRSSRAASAAAAAAASRPRASPSPDTDIGWRGAVERWGPALRCAALRGVRAEDDSSERRLDWNLDLDFGFGWNPSFLCCFCVVWENGERARVFVRLRVRRSPTTVPKI